MPVRRVIETCLYVADVERSAAWYERVLGLEHFAGSPPRDAFLAAGDSCLLLFNADETRGPSELPTHGADGVQHVAFGVEDEGELAEMRARLKEEGVDIVHETGFGQGSSVYFHDPDGNVVELVTKGTWPNW